MSQHPQLSAILTELRREFDAFYGKQLAQLVLYGSQARGDAGEGWDSDIDVMVVLTGGVDPGAEIERSGEIVAALSLKYDVVVSCFFISAARFETAQIPLLRNVRREGVPI